MYNENMEEEMKKSYNPFQMWGSWVGTIAVFGYFLIGIIEKVTREGFFTCGTFGGPQGGDSPQCSFSEFITGPMIFVYLLAIGGFLIGWAIHSIIRKYKK